MTMPTWDETLTPLLKLFSDGVLHQSDEVKQYIISYFSVTDEERSQRLKSGQPTIFNRLFWGISHLHKAGLIDYGAARGTYSITDAGLKFLKEHPNGITEEDLLTIPSFRDWKTRVTKKGNTTPVPAKLVRKKTTPEDEMDNAYNELNQQLAEDILDQLKNINPYSFESLVTDLVVNLGYGGLVEDAAFVTKKSGDGGVDGIVRLDKLGLDKIYIQAKRWTKTAVGSPEIKGFIGSLVTKGANKGIFITTSTFTNDAINVADHEMNSSNISVVLIDGMKLANMMIELNIGVVEKAKYTIKVIDKDFFENQ